MIFKSVSDLILHAFYGNSASSGLSSNLFLLKTYIYNSLFGERGGQYLRKVKTIAEDVIEMWNLRRCKVMHLKTRIFLKVSLNVWERTEFFCEKFLFNFVQDCYHAVSVKHIISFC